MNAPRIGRHGFGWIEVNCQRWNRDIVISARDGVLARPKHLSKKYGGWHTVLGPEEIEYVLESNPETLLIGCGHFGLLPIRPEARALLADRGVPTEIARLPRIITQYEAMAKQGKRVAALLHVTC